MTDLADNDLQRLALTRLNARTVALREGMAKLTEQLANRTELLRNTIDASQADAIGAIDESFGEDAPARAEGAGDLRPGAVGHFAPGAVDRGDLPRHHPVRRRADRALDPAAAAADHGGDARDHLGRLRSHGAGHNAEDEVGAMARAVEVFRENAIAKRKTEDELRTSKEKAESALLELNTAQQNLIDAERLAALGGSSPASPMRSTTRSASA